MSLKRSSFVSGLAAGSAIVAAGQSARSQSAQKITVGYWPVAAALPFFVGIKFGYFQAAGLDLDFIKFADQVKVTEALLAGRIDATATGTGSTQLALAEIAQTNFFKILAANLSSDKSVLDEIIVAKGSSYRKVSDLKGKRVATGVGPQAMLEAKLIFARNGVESIPIELAPAQHVAALASGQVDAVYTYEPNGTVGRMNGTVDVLEVGVRSKYLLGDASAPWYGGAAVVSTEYLAKNPAGVKAYISGLKKSMDKVRSNLNLSRAVYPSYTSFDVKLAEAVPAISYTMFDEFKPSDIAYFQKNYDLFFDQKILSRKLAVASMLYKA